MRPDRLQCAGWAILVAALLLEPVSLTVAAAQSDAEPASAGESRPSQSAEEEEEVDEPLSDLSRTRYIDDAVIASRFRLRYSSGFGATKPDRAEFFYGKCDCFETNFGQDAASPGPVFDLDFRARVVEFLRGGGAHGPMGSCFGAGEVFRATRWTDCGKPRLTIPPWRT